MSSIQLAVLALSIAAPPEPSSDWPQWRGPNRDGISNETGLLKQWPADGPKLLWKFDKTGLGYSSCSVVGDALYTLGAIDDKSGNKEFALAADITTGKERWRVEIGTYFNFGNWGGGPRGTPTVDGDFLYALGGNGDLACVDRVAGKIVWKKNFKTDFNGGCGHWGYAESVLIDSDRVICTPGGPDGAMVALNKKTGAIVWRSPKTADDAEHSFTDKAEYSSPMVLEAGGVRQYVIMTKGGTYGIDAKDGRKLWSDKLGVNQVATIPTPIVEGNTVYVTSNYPDGTSGLLKITSKEDFTVEKVYDTTKLLKNHHGGVIKVGNYVYGHSQAGSVGNAWVCVDFKSGALKWKEDARAKESIDKGSICYADGSFYALGEKSGTCVKFAASPDGWREEGRLTLPKQDSARAASGGIWSHPVVAHGKLFLRDQNYLYCYDVHGR